MKHYDDEPLKEALQQERIQHFPRSQSGRIMLVRELANRWGDGYRNVPEARRALAHFDEEIEHEKALMRIRRLRNG